VSRDPGPDELAIRDILRLRGVGPDALGDTMATDDWWNDLYDEPDTELKPDADEEPDVKESTAPAPVWWQAQPDYYPHPHMPALVTRTRDRAEAAISPRTRKLLYNASAAAAGWGLGLYQQCAHALAVCGQQYSISGALTLGIGGSLLVAHVWDRRTRHWWPGIAWAARIPLATCLLALALWAPAAT
jgi:hypothetical protein